MKTNIEEDNKNEKLGEMKKRTSLNDNISGLSDRYSRQILFGPIGIKGQKKLDNDKISIKSITVILILLLVISVQSLFGCTVIDAAGEYLYGKFSSEKEMDRAVEVAGAFFNLLMDEDYRQAYKYISSSDRDRGSEQDFVDEFKDITKIIRADINWVEIKGNTALLGVDLLDSYDGEEKMYKDIELSLIKEEDGNWKVVFWK